MHAIIFAPKTVTTFSLTVASDPPLVCNTFARPYFPL